MVNLPVQCLDTLDVGQHLFPAAGIQHHDVMCPGFLDCFEYRGAQLTAGFQLVGQPLHVHQAQHQGAQPVVAAMHLVIQLIGQPRYCMGGFQYPGGTLHVVVRPGGDALHRFQRLV